jgi:hypothetical protein
VQSGAYRDWVSRNYAERVHGMKILLLGRTGRWAGNCSALLSLLGEVVALDFDSPGPLSC